MATQKDRSAPCSVDGCPNVVRNRGMCQRHYNDDRRIRNSVPGCSVDGCSRPVSAHGKCRTHYETELRKTNQEFAERQRENSRRWHEANHERVRAYQAERLERERNCPVHKEKKREYRLKKCYGLTIADYNALLAEQGHKCAICGSEEAKRKDGVFHVDHDHDTGVVRGILCFKCNQALGHFGDNIDGIMRVVEYLKRSAP